ncbi:beta-lactamase/transpeptidase-like protein [Tricladium varicosporioides]|nr:beta-lactamase/transpeptidase-like protein [Hymenoscyphus varicosporioides]
MMFFRHSFTSLVKLNFIFASLVHSSTLPAVLGPAFPPPTNLGDDLIIKSATEKFLALVKNALSTGTSTHGDFDASSTAFSFEFYSTTDDSPPCQYHYSPPMLANSSFGVKKVDRNSVYRIGSVTKLLTVYSFLISDGDAHFNDPVTKYVPELLAATSDAAGKKDSVHRIAWNDVTIGALASYMAGVGEEYGWLDVSLGEFPFSRLGLPQLSPSEIPACGAGSTKGPCSRQDFLRGFARRDPVFATFQTPVYSNGAFQVLAYALERIAGKPIGNLMDDILFKPLKLAHTSYVLPKDSFGVIPGEKNTTYWNFELGELWPTGGVWSSPADLTAIGRSILSSTLISPAQTRRWMKPMTHTSALLSAVGAPWEIQRVQLPSSRIVDVYTKNGVIGAYASYMILIPDYDVGFTILAAGVGTNADVLAGFIADSFLPALEEASRTQAAKTYAGTYKSGASTFTLTTDATVPGISLSNWINNGTAVVPLFPIFISLAVGDTGTANALLQYYESGVPLIDPKDVTVRLYPSGLRSSTVKGQQIVSFRAVFGIATPIVDTSPFADTRAGWEIADVIVYGNSGLDEFIFTIDANGKVLSAENTFLRQVLQKV